MQPDNLKKFDWKKILLSSFIFLLIAFVIRQIESFLTMKYYLMPEYFGVWSKLMMPKAGPPPLKFMLTSIWFTFVTGFTLALVYSFIKDILPKNYWKRVFLFADITIALSFVFFTLPAYLLFNLPLGLLVSWFISSFIVILLGTMVFVRLIK